MSSFSQPGVHGTPGVLADIAGGPVGGELFFLIEFKKKKVISKSFVINRYMTEVISTKKEGGEEETGDLINEEMARLIIIIF